MLAGNFVEGYEDGWIDTAGIVEEGAGDGFDSGFVCRAEERGFQCFVRFLWGFAVDWGGPIVRGIFGAFGGRMGKFGECFLDVAGHEYVDVPFVIVPVEGEAAVLGAFPVDGTLVGGFNCVDEVFCVGFCEILDAEVVDTEGEGGAFGGVTPEAWGKGHWFVAEWFHFADELDKGNDTGFFESVHTSANFDNGVSIVVEFDFGIFVEDFLWDVLFVDAHHVLEI